MKQPLLILTCFLTLIACTNSDTPKTTINTQADQQIDSVKLTRNILIKELKRLRQIISSNDKEKIAGIFEFPLSDTSFSVYVDDSTYLDQFKENGNKTTKQMFLQHFKEVSENIWVNQLNMLFKNINIDSLLFKDALEHEAYIRKEPCFYTYKIEVIKDSVILRMDINSNRNYKTRKSSNEDTPENSSELCEHSFWWNFRFNGKKLRFENIAGAD